MQPLTKQEAIDFFSLFYGGEHNIPHSSLMKWGEGWSLLDKRDKLSTFDNNELSVLVVLAHDKCLRVSIAAARNGKIRICIWKRKREGGVLNSHPSLEEHVSQIRQFITTH